tara:strand:- start:10471 stop:11082 length:612 start_codon:yes stop_codon:yes gene_type:complete
MWWTAVPAVLQGLGSLYSKKQEIKALNKQKQMGKYEKEYFKRLESEAKQGDPMYQQKLNQAISPIRQQGQFMQQRATGTAIQQGLENSIIASELRNRASRATMGQISQASERMAMQNAEFKRQAQGRLDQARLSREEKLRGIAQQQAGIRSSMVGDVIGMGAGLAGQYAQRQQPQLTQAQVGGKDLEDVYWDPTTRTYTDMRK